MVNKLNKDIDNPFDIIMYNIIDKHLHFYHKYNINAHKLTTLSLISWVISAYEFYKDKYIISGIWFLISYYFDCADGKYARSYNQVTKIGDLYDHINDMSKFIVIIGLMYYKDKQKLFKIAPFLIIITILMQMFITCQETIYNKQNESIFLNSINSIKLLNKNQCNKYIKYLKYFSPGTGIIIIILIIIFWNNI